MSRPLPSWWMRRLLAVRTATERVLDPRRLSDDALEDIRARIQLESEAPPLSSASAVRAWRQAHTDRAALLGEVEALRSLLARRDADECGAHALPPSKEATFAKE